MFKAAHEISGGILVTSPYPEDMEVPDVKTRLQEYLKGKESVPVDYRLKVARLLEDITASYQGGWYSVISIVGGGPPEAEKIEIMRKYDLEERMSHVEKIIGIKD